MKIFIPKEINEPIEFIGPYVVKYFETHYSIVDDIMIIKKTLYPKVFVYPDGDRCIFFYKKKEDIPKGKPDVSKFKEYN